MANGHGIDAEWLRWIFALIATAFGGVIAGMIGMWNRMTSRTDARLDTEANYRSELHSRISTAKTQLAAVETRCAVVEKSYADLERRTEKLEEAFEAVTEIRGMMGAMQQTLEGIAGKLL